MNSIRIFVLILATGTIAPLQGNAFYDFAHYEHKTRKFLEYYGHQTPGTVSIKPIEQYQNRPGWVIRAYRDQEGIHLNMDEFTAESHGINLFTCAHEAAHWVFHDISAKGYDIEQDADTKAAEMLCNNGYAWVVQEKITQLAAMIEEGHGDTSDANRPRPTVRTRHQYLSHILDSYLVSHPLQARFLKLHAGWDITLLIGSHIAAGLSGIALGAALTTSRLFNTLFYRDFTFFEKIS